MTSETLGDVNDILEHIGNMKKYQLCTLFLTSLFYCAAAMQTLVIVFTQADMDFRNIWPALANMFLMFGRIPGGLLTGQLADRIGRKKTITIGLFLLGGFGLGTAYSVNLTMYIIFRFFSAVPIAAIYNGCATLITEVVSPSKRAHVVIGLVYSWGIGICLLSLFAYFIRDWRTLHMAVSLPNFVLCPLAFWLFDESPHWLYSQGRYKEAQAVLEKIASRNKMDDRFSVVEHHKERKDTHSNQDGNKTEIDGKLNSSSSTSEDDSKHDPGQCMQMLKTQKFVVILLICAFGWLACDMGYAGLAIGSGLLPGNVYINNAIGGGVELIAYSMALLVIPGGRKKIYILLVAFGGIALIASAFVKYLLSESQ
ncbi:solute carrier family 22 member 21-like [Watersipora subatra]|uniref:solute carrier family 22 member 21-like n=1 Tax=Watersipora subatra TaxID=2589382 RepID=UPI00355B94C3